MKKILIIGAGPSGVMAAINAARKGHYAEIWEKNDKSCRKLLVSGNGRCNITNKNLSTDNYFGKDVRLLADMFSIFDNKDTITFFKEIGLEIIEEDLGRMFPRTLSSASVYDILLGELAGDKVKLVLNNSVSGIEPDKGSFNVASRNGGKRAFDCIVISAGGKSYPELGTTGDGYDWARKFGHTVLKPLPALAPVVIKNKLFNNLQGIKIKAGIKAKNQVFEGDLLFTKYGLSGTAIIDMSLPFSGAINSGNLDVFINFFPEFTPEAFNAYLRKRWNKMQEKTLVESFIGILPSRVARVITSLIPEIDNSQKVSEISAPRLNAIVQNLTEFKIPVAASLGFSDAQVTAGGVSLSEINTKTMESKLCKNLYFTGEVLDATGMCGGYNLQFAWTTGFIAGNSL